MAVTYTYAGLQGDIEFDFTNQEINIDPLYTDFTIQELVNAAREAEFSSVGVAFPKILNAEGKTVLDPVNGIQIAITCILLDEWVLYTRKSSGLFKVFGGNLVQVSGGDVFKGNVLVSEMLFNSVAGVIVTVSSGSGLSGEEHTKLMATYGTEDRSTLAAIQTAVGQLQSGQLTKDQFIDILLNRTNTIAGGKITSYKAGTGENEKIVDVTYDDDAPAAEVVRS